MEKAYMAIGTFHQHHFTSFFFFLGRDHMLCTYFKWFCSAAELARHFNYFLVYRFLSAQLQRSLCN